MFKSICKITLLIAMVCNTGSAFSQQFNPSNMEELLYGVAYYYEYMPTERLQDDIKMMKTAGINTVRICESTWSYMEPQDGVFKLEHVGRILDEMHKNNIKVIVGTPTYAFPSWLDKKYPDILLTNKNGQRLYGGRQAMDITNKNYLFHAERMIRKLMEYVHEHPAIIGYQVDNETKHYGTEGENVQQLFKEHLKNKFETTEALNAAYGFSYWSNSIYSWDDLPSTMGTINASYRCEFEQFRRGLVTEFLAWQVAIVNEFKKPEQFVTQNFDMEWRDMSYSIQADVDHFEAARAMDIAGVDIYHATADELDGVMIAFGGDLARSMKNSNYLVVETQAQSINPSSNQRLVYPNQLRLQAYSHVASGANMVAYWPWHSIHNSAETYWKGLLSHDLQENPTYNEAKTIGAEFAVLSEHLVNLKKENKVAIYFSNEALSALKEFPINKDLTYGDIVRKFYELLYKMNVECDFIDHSSQNIESYDLIIVPPLYVAEKQELERLNAFAENGGELIYCFKSGFSNEHVQVRTEIQPAVIKEVCGVKYQQFTSIDKLALSNISFEVNAENNYVQYWAELLTADEAEVLAKYDHPYWKEYAAITRNSFGKGSVYYLGTWPSDEILKKLLKKSLMTAKIEVPEYEFPIIVRAGLNGKEKIVRYFLNYSQSKQNIIYSFTDGINLHAKSEVQKNSMLAINPWNLIIVEEK